LQSIFKTMFRKQPKSHSRLVHISLDALEWLICGIANAARVGWQRGMRRLFVGNSASEIQVQTVWKFILQELRNAHFTILKSTKNIFVDFKQQISSKNFLLGPLCFSNFFLENQMKFLFEAFWSFSGYLVVFRLPICDENPRVARLPWLNLICIQLGIVLKTPKQEPFKPGLPDMPIFWKFFIL
jgi:hypothetical protein